MDIHRKVSDQTPITQAYSLYIFLSLFVYLFLSLSLTLRLFICSLCVQEQGETMERIFWLMLPQSGPSEIMIIWLYVASPPGRLIRGGNLQAKLGIYSRSFRLVSCSFYARATSTLTFHLWLLFKYQQLSDTQRYKYRYK